MRIETIDETSPHLEMVIALGRAHRDTLGFLPVGGFQDYARDRHIIVALNDAGQCVGYLLYRIVRDRATIAHFCVPRTVQTNGETTANAIVKEAVEARRLTGGAERHAALFVATGQASEHHAAVGNRPLPSVKYAVKSGLGASWRDTVAVLPGERNLLHGVTTLYRIAKNAHCSSLRGRI